MNKFLNLNSMIRRKRERFEINLLRNFSLSSLSSSFSLLKNVCERFRLFVFRFFFIYRLNCSQLCVINLIIEFVIVDVRWNDDNTSKRHAKNNNNAFVIWWIFMNWNQFVSLIDFKLKRFHDCVVEWWLLKRNNDIVSNHERNDNKYFRNFKWCHLIDQSFTRI